MDMQKHVATKIALTVLDKVRATDHWQDLNLEINWEELEHLISEPNFDELMTVSLKDSESFNLLLDKLNEDVDAEIKRLENSLID